MLRKLAFLGVLISALCGVTTVSAQVTYQLGPATPLLNQDYYDGVDANGAGASPSGRLAYFASPSNDGTQVAFWMVSGDFSEVAVFVATIGVSDSWRRLTTDLATFPNAPIAWTPDDAYLLVGSLKFDVLTGTSEATNYDGIVLNDSSTTNLPSGNWIATLEDDVDGHEQIALIPIFPNGDLDNSREITFVTNVPLGVGPYPDWPAISPDGSQVAFADYESVTPGTADRGDVYVLKDLAGIIAAPKLPGTFISILAVEDPADPRLYPVRTNEDAVDNFSHAPRFAQDQSILFFVEDWNNVFEDSNFFGTLATADLDVMLTNSDGSGSDIRFTSAGNQFITSVTPGGVRVLYLQGVGTDFHLFISSLETSTVIAGTTVGAPLENVIQTTSLQQARDASGTVIEIEENTVIDFPDSAPQEIEIFTPIDPVLEAEVPEGVDGIPVVRDFGPDGTTFTIPVAVTISYTDAEIAGYVESNLRVFLYNPATMTFDSEVTTIVSRDTAANTITFTVDHFSTYGLGGMKGAGMPVGGSYWLLAILVVMLAGLGVHTRRRTLAIQ